MRLAMIGLGKMGFNMTVRLLRAGHKVAVFDRSPAAVRKAARSGALGSRSLSDAVAKLKPPRVVWLMIPAGEPVRATVKALAPLLSKGDIIVDGGNSHYKDAVEHARLLAPRGVRFVDAGVSGGVWGLKEGYCLMVGGEKAAVRTLRPALRTLAPKDGYARVGPPGAGHFVKMVHNGVEYAMMQAYAEGFELMEASTYPLDLHGVASLWRRGSVVRSWLLDLTERALRKDPKLRSVRGFVPDSGEGRWTVQEAVDSGVPAPAIALSLFRRFRSRQDGAFADKLLSALRGEFGGHAVKRSGSRRK